jgi:hypothetical protein
MVLESSAQFENPSTAGDKRAVSTVPAETNDGTLITVVEKYEQIYHLEHSVYSNHQRRNNIWEEI